MLFMLVKSLNFAPLHFHKMRVFNVDMCITNTANKCLIYFDK